MLTSSLLSLLNTTILSILSTPVPTEPLTAEPKFQLPEPASYVPPRIPIFLPGTIAPPPPLRAYVKLQGSPIVPAPVPPVVDTKKSKLNDGGGAGGIGALLPLALIIVAATGITPRTRSQSLC